MNGFVLYDKMTGEYLTVDGDWLDAHESAEAIPVDARIYPTLHDAASGLDDVFGAWDTRFSLPDRNEYEIVEVRPSGWERV